MLDGEGDHGEAARGGAGAGQEDGDGGDDDDGADGDGGAVAGGGDGVPGQLVRQARHWLPVQEPSRSFWFVPIIYCIYIYISDVLCACTCNLSDELMNDISTMHAYMCVFMLFLPWLI